MKKFRFAAGLMSLAMLGACSSDNPEVVVPDNNGDDTGMYLAVKVIGDQSTRDDQTTVETLAAEERIQKLQIFILDENENLYFTKTCSAGDISGGLAKFSVTTATYNDMIAKYNRGANMKIIVYANGTTLKTSDEILHKSTENRTWGIETEDGVNKINNVGCFIMSNAEDCTGQFADPGTADGSDAKPWLIKTNIKLARLSTRFEYSTDNKDSYTALHEKGIEMSIAGFDIETYATSTYRVSMFSADGTQPTSIDINNHGHYAPTTAFPYRVTDSYGASDEFGTYTDYNYVITKDNKYTYKRPNTVSKNYTFQNNKEDFKKAPFAVIKAKFECKDFAGTGAPSVSMAAGKKVFAINGIFLGGLDDYKALKKAGKEFQVNYDNSDNRFSESDIARINLVEQNYNRILEMSLPSSYDNTKTETDDEKWLQAAFDGADVYTADNGSYYTYYAQLITHDATSQDPYWKYGVSRNLSYVLMVKSFKWLGNNGTGHPGDGPEASELSEMAIQLSVEPVKWTANFANKWDL